MNLFERRRKSARWDHALLTERRIVVVDVETSGLDPHSGRLIAIGAVAVHAGAITFDDSLRVILRQAQASTVQNILVHGIDTTTQLAGDDPPGALAAWLAFCGDGPVAGFDADFDRIVIARATKAALGIKPSHVWLDLAFLAPALFASASEVHATKAPHNNSNTLDDWLRHFGIEVYARHDALADALATAQLLQIVLAEAARRGMHALGALRALEHDQRWLMRSLRL